jgi:cholesterol oxidase
MKPRESDESSQYSPEQPSSKYSRRKFLQLSGAVGLLAALPLTSWPDEALGASKSTIPSPSKHKKAIIIGSGFGGAITALRLSEQGIESMLIEKGRRWPIQPDGNTFSPYIYPDGRSTWLNYTTVVPISPPLPIKRYVGVLEGQGHGRLRVLMGSCYGGGSIVYGASM